jgi:hypothetical protein
MSKTKAIFLQILTFLPTIYSTLIIMPYTKKIFSINNINIFNFMSYVLIVIGLITLYIFIFEILPIFRFNIQKKFSDYIWFAVALLGFWFILPLYWYVNILKKFKKENYIYIYRQNGKIQPMLNEKEKM